MTDKPENNGSKSFYEFFSVYFIAIIFCGTISIWGVFAPEQITGAALTMTGFMLKTLDWFFLLLCTFFVGLSLYLALGPYGHVKLGKDDEEPEFSTISWLSMLFSAGMGCGLLFWGAAEPMFHYMDPPGMEGGTPQAARFAMLVTNLHWGVHAWGIYAVSAVVLAYFGFRKGRPYLPSAPIRAALTGKNVESICHTTDVVAVLSVVFGLAGSLAAGILQIKAGIGAAFPIPPDILDQAWLSVAILVVVTVIFMLSSSTGLDKGIKILSNINMVAAALLVLFLLFVGPTRFVLATFVTSLGDYISNLVSMSFRLFPYQNLQDWSATWTLTYLIWWIAWGPFVGIFIARISRGRTIRQFIFCVVLIPTVFSVFWFAIFGGAGFYIEMFGGGGLGELIREDVTKALFAFLEYFPLAGLLKILAIFLIFVFLVTSADSATFVVSMMTSHGSLSPSTAQKLQWGIIMAVITGVTVVSGGIDVAKAIAISGAIPFTIILIVQIMAFLKILVSDEKKA